VGQKKGSEKIMDGHELLTHLLNKRQNVRIRIKWFRENCKKINEGQQSNSIAFRNSSIADM
jgi:hypothetical protein